MQCFLKLKIEGLQKAIAIFLMILYVTTLKYSTPVNVNGIYILGHMNSKQLPKTALVRRMNLQDNVGMNLTNLTASKKNFLIEIFTEKHTLFQDSESHGQNFLNVFFIMRS